MKVPRYWEKETVVTNSESGQPFETSCWGWSTQSPDEARSRAAVSAARVAERLRKGVDLPHQYGYDERLPREEIIDEILDGNGQTHAFVTRNSYGSLILNTRDLMFIDVDFPPTPSISLPKFLRKFFGSAPADPEVSVGERIHRVAQEFQSLGIRIYRTYNGFRLMISARPIQAESDEAQRLLDAFDADPLYRRMCTNQQCFRARLSPKAWRCQLDKPPARFPFTDEGQESAFRRWEEKYVGAITDYSTCRYVETIGEATKHPSLISLIELHDTLTKATSSDPLA